MQFSKVVYDTVVMNGGLDLLTPTLELPPGVLRDVINFECSPTGGYSRVDGYERYDGHASPSSGTYSAVQIAAFVNNPTLNQTLTGQTSGATGVIIALGTNYIVLTALTGSFQVAEVVKVGAATIGTTVALTANISPLLGAQYTAAAADYYRTLISAVPGSGSVLGVVTYVDSTGADNTYAFRANGGGTAVNLYKSTTGGWSQVTFFNTVAFTAGNSGVSGTSVPAPAEGGTLTQGGVTATIKRVVDSSGKWDSTNHTAAGNLIISTPSGGNFTSGSATTSDGYTVTLSGVQTAITFTPGGKFEFRIGNFSGQRATTRVYGCDGVNKAFEFDGTILAPIPSGTSPDTPKHIEVHKQHLILSIASSMILSGPGLPYRFGSIDGGAEIATGDTITQFLVQPGAQATAAMAVLMFRNSGMLYGTDASSWNFVSYNAGVGCLDYMGQNMNQSYWLDDSGVISMSATLAYGNFAMANLTARIRTFLQAERVRASYSVLMRQKNQIRMFYSDGYGLYGTIVNGKVIGFSRVYFPTPVYMAWTDTRANGTEVSFFGGTDGYVYQLDQGTSFDGANIDAYITFNWNAMKSPRLLKRFRHAAIEIQALAFLEIQFGYSLGYASLAYAQPTSDTYDANFLSAPMWDSFIWDNFTWDGVTLGPIDVDLTGTAENVQMVIRSSTNYLAAYTINSVITHYTPRRGLR